MALILFSLVLCNYTKLEMLIDLAFLYFIFSLVVNFLVFGSMFTRMITR